MVLAKFRIKCYALTQVFEHDCRATKEDKEWLGVNMVDHTSKSIGERCEVRENNH